MKITKQRLKEIIKEELTVEGYREDMMMPAISQADMEAAMATDDEKFTGGTHEERLLTLIKAREVLAAMSKEELEKLSLSLDAETTRWLQHLLANPMYAPMQEGQDEDEELLGRLKQKYGRKAAHLTVNDIQELHPSYKGSLRDVAQGLGIR